MVSWRRVSHFELGCTSTKSGEASSSGIEREPADSFGPYDSLCREPDCRGASIEYARLTEAWERNFVSLRLYNTLFTTGAERIVKSIAEQRWKIVDISNCQNFVRRNHIQALSL